MSSDSDNTYSLRHHTHKRKKIVISDSDSSDESVIVQTRRKKKILRVVSEGESSSDDSDVPKPVIRRQNHRVISEDESNYNSSAEESKSSQNDSSSSSEWQSDWSSSDELEEDNKKYNKRKVLSKTKSENADKPGSSSSTNANANSDSSDDQSEKCPICLLPFRKQQVGNPSECDHCFCLECLMEWSKNINTCPVDRIPFTKVVVREHFDGKVINHLPVEAVPRIENQVLDDPTFCEICHQSDREDRMLLCDNCDRGYHMECLTPPITTVPIEEWYCPGCTRNSSTRTYLSSFVPTLITSGRNPSRFLRQIRRNLNIFRNMLPHFDRTYVPASRTRRVHDQVPRGVLFIDPNQPSTSSGLDSIGDNSRSRSPNTSLEGNASSTRSNTKSKTKTTKRKKKKLTKNSKKSGTNLLREVRIKEFNNDGEEEEIVTYVKVASTSRRKCKKRSKKTRKRRKYKRRTRTEASVLSTRTVKRRLASALGIKKPKVPLQVPTMKNNTSVPEKSALINARYSAGIPQVSLFGNNLGFTYSPPGSDDDDEYSIGTGNGPLINIRQRRSAVPSIRRRAVLKTIVDPVNEINNTAITDLLSSIMSSQELWHSTKKKDNVILKADGTLMVNSPERENKHSINNNESPKREKQDEKEVTRHEETILEEVNTPLDLSNINSNDITQAPMYNNPCGGGGGSGGGGGNRGNFRGSYGRDNGRHSGHGGQTYGGRDSLPPGGGGRHNYSGGTGGGGPRDNFGNRDFGPPPFYNPNFEHCGRPPMFGAHAPPPPFRSRNPQHFRNERMRFPPPPLPAERPFNYTDGSGGFEQRPPFPHVTDRFPRPRPPALNIPPPSGPSIAPPNTPDPMNMQQPMHMHNSLPPVSLPEDMTRNYQPPPEQNDRIVMPDSVAVSPVIASPATASPATRQDNDDCDIYCDIEPPSKPDCDAQEELHSNGSMILLPPPEPPSGLLDFEENSRSDKDDSEQELVIDDSHKEDIQRDLPPSGDKYDPFAVDSDSNDDAATPLKTALEKTEVSRNSLDSCNIPMPIVPPATYPSIPIVATTAQSRERPQESIRLTAYDDEDDNDSQSDCPNFSIYSSQTMDVARHTEQELSQQLGPLQPPPIPPNIPDDDDIIVGDIQACDLPDVPPEPADPYVEALQKERQTLSKIPPKKISHDSRGKITFKIGSKLRLNNRLSGLHSDDHSQNTSFLQKRTVTAPPIDKQQQERDDDKNVSSSKSAIESTAVQSSLTLKLMKIGPSFAEEEKNIESVTTSPKKKEPLKLASRRGSKELRSESSSDEEATKMDEGSRCIDASSSRKEEEDSEQEVQLVAINAMPHENVAIVESAVSSSSLDIARLSPRKLDGSELSIECSSEDLEGGDTVSKIALSNLKTELRSEVSALDKSREWETTSSDDDEHLPSGHKLAKADCDKDDDKASSDNEDPNSSDQRHEKESFSTVDDEAEQFPIEKDKLDEPPVLVTSIDNNWESDGAYTPCKDELPVRDEMQMERCTALFEAGLEPITPTKDKTNDDLDDCRSPAGYAELGTEAISETDEAINFEEELNALALRKEKEMEDGEILDESKLDMKEREKLKDDKEDENKKKKKKDKKEKSKESTEKNKENISSDNLVAWKKLSKSTKDRPYRDKDKRSKSKDKEKEKDKSSKKKTKEIGKKKEKRKELLRYDVRKIVKPRKDEYGRDIREKSRSRSRSRSSNKIQSGSKDRRSQSYSKGRSKSRSRLRLSWSRDRGQSYSKSCRSNSRRRSSSRTRRKSRRRSMSRRRSLSRRHSISRRRSRSLSRKRRSLSPRRRTRRSLSRSRDKRKDKAAKYKSRSRSRNRKRSRSKSPKRMSSKSREKKHGKRKAHSRSRSKGRSISRDRNRNWDQLNEKSVEQEQQQFPRAREEHERSWSAQWTPSWSRSRSKTPPHIQPEPIGARNWSPPSVLDSVSPKNLTVILTNKEAIKKKKKERRKESRKSKEAEKRRKSKRNRTPPPSKEVFASGDNILVSVCFNKDNETNPSATPELPPTAIPLSPPIKRRRRESVQTEPAPSAKRSKKEKTKDKRSKSPKVKKDKKKKSKAAEIAATKKPVAVIDLDQSPFREQTPSPRDVIVLSDDDDKQAQETLAASPEQCPPSQASPPREQFVSQGPKTPPEPQIKFSINKQPSNLRPSLINPLLEEEEEEEEEMMDERAEEELEMRAQEELELRLKIGPNTPPEPPTSPPTSPDAYDPFDPTKSRSPTPDASQEATPNDERDRAQRNSPRKHDGAADTPLPMDEPSQQQEQPSQEKPIEKPKIISMVTIKRPSPPRDVSASPVPESQTDIVQSCGSSPPKTQQNPQNVQSTANPFSTINPVLATVAAAVQRSFNASTPNTTQRTLLQPNRISPSNQIKQRLNDRPQLPNIFTNSAKSSTIARSSKSTQNKNSSTVGQNGSDATIDITNDNVVDMSSPYSPGSTLSDGLFDPPSPANFNNSPVANAPPPAPAKTNTPKVNKSAEKKDAFDALFGGILPPVKTATKNRSKKVAKEKTKKSTNPKVGVRMDENQLQILDDLPSSAVEMQVKDKFLKKLNRQERVVEEVKLVLKPHYTKKHITKEEYKDIMRKAVPKICHNKTGEINPKKIGLLIEAYVKKCRNNKKKTSAKITKPSKTLWS